MSWYNLGGKVEQFDGAEDLYLHDVLRIPNWPTQAAAAGHPYTLNTAQAAGLGGLIGSQATTAGQAAQAASNPQAAVPGLSSVDQFLGQLGSANLWIRVAEVVIGIVLMAIGVAKLTSAVPAATKIASMIK